MFSLGFSPLPFLIRRGLHFSYLQHRGGKSMYSVGLIKLICDLKNKKFFKGENKNKVNWQGG